MKINTQLYPLLYIRLHCCIYFSFVLARFRCQFQSPSREKRKKKETLKTSSIVTGAMQSSKSVVSWASWY